MKRRLMAVLMACVMTLSLLPISVLATENSGMEFTKDARDNRDGTYTISMEAWATGKTTTQEKPQPLDIALVLDVSGSMDDPFAGTYQKKIDALKTAVNGFIEGVAAKSPDSKISIVKFAGDMANWVGNDTYQEGRYRYNHTQVVVGLTPVAQAETLKATVNSLRAGGATSADYGMQLANTALQSATNPKVVVMFTDGKPNHDSGFDYSVAAEVVNTARSMKAGGTTIYTVGVFDSTNDQDINTYMSSTSSNCPNASAEVETHWLWGTTGWNVTAGGSNSGKYYKTASSAEELNNIFTTISQEISSAANAALNASTTVVDTLSEYFTFADTNPVSSVKVYTADWNGNSWNEAVEAPANVTPSVDGKTVRVTGYDYAANYVHETQGQKLIIEITVVPSGIGCASPQIPTNADGDMHAAQVVLNQTVVTSAPGKTITGHAVIYDLNGGQSEKDFPTLYYPAGATVPVTGNVPTKDNHKFTGWMRDNAIVAANTSLEILNDDITLVAQWELSTHSVTGTIDENGTVTNDNQTSVKHNEACTDMVFTPNPGYKIASVTVNNVPETNFVIGEDGTYTYSNPQVTGDIVVVVTTEIDDSQTKDTKYTVVHKVDGVEKESKEYTGTAWVNELKPEITVETGSLAEKTYPGYKFDSMDPKVKEGDKVASGTIITLNYVRDDSQTKPTKYTVRYTIEGVEQENDKIEVEGSAWVNDEPAMIAIAEGGIPTPSNKYNGYKLDPANPEYPAAGTPVESGSEYTVNYVKRTDLSYTVHYYLKDTTTKLADDKVVIDQTFGVAVTEKALDIAGYNVFGESERTITIGVGANEIIFYYTRVVYPYVPVVKPALNRDDHYAYVVGYPDGMVRPSGNITRAEAATIFFRLLTDDSRNQFWMTTNTYSDVNRGDWFNNAVSTLSNAGIISGYPDGTFRPNAPITRAEMSKIIALFAKLNKSEDRFNDIAGHWAEAYIKLAAGNGWIAGYPDGSFKPQQNITRAETMTMINRVLERVPSVESHLLPYNAMLTFPDCQSGQWFYIAVQEATNSHTYERAASEKNGDEQWIALRANRDWTQFQN